MVFRLFDTRDNSVWYQAWAPELPGGGWSFAGGDAETDITAMALQALAKYRDRQDVADAVERGLTVLSQQQEENGGFVAYDSESSESIAQVIVALTVLLVAQALFHYEVWRYGASAYGHRLAIAAAVSLIMIIGGVLPLDLEGHRSGRPDALVRGVDHAEGSPGYWPLKVKPYRVREKQSGSTSLQTSPLADIGALVPLPDLRYRVYREGVLLELAHYWRLLESCGFASSEPLAAVV